MRFGLEDGSEHTLEEVGQSFAVTRERIRQIEAKALRKCVISRSRKLRAFLDGVRTKDPSLRSGFRQRARTPANLLKLRAFLDGVRD